MKPFSLISIYYSLINAIHKQFSKRNKLQCTFKPLITPSFFVFLFPFSPQSRCYVYSLLLTHKYVNSLIIPLYDIIQQVTNILLIIVQLTNLIIHVTHTHTHTHTHSIFSEWRRVLQRWKGHTRTMQMRKRQARLLKKTHRSDYRRFLSTELVSMSIMILFTQTDLPASTLYYSSQFLSSYSTLESSKLDTCQLRENGVSFTAKLVTENLQQFLVR